MGIYIFSALLSLFFAHMYQMQAKRIGEYRKKEVKYLKKQKIDTSLLTTLKWLSMLPVIIITGIRYRVGTDYMYYANSFLSITRGGDGYFSDPLYNVVQWVVHFFTNDYAFLFIVCAIIFCYFFWDTSFKISYLPVYSILLVFLTNTYFISLNGLRQGLSMAILFYAMSYLLNRQEKKFYICVVCAAMFHNSALVFLPLFRLSLLQLNAYRIMKYLMAGLLLSLFGKNLIYGFMKLTNYYHYFVSTYANDSFEWILVLINVVILLVLCFYLPKATKAGDEKMYNIYLWLQLLAVIFAMMSGILPLAKRITWIFGIGQILALPLLTKYENSKIGKVILNIGIIICFALSIYIGDVQNGAHGIVPYNTIFSK